MDANILTQYPTKIIKLGSGEELICYLCETTDKTYKVRFPYGLIPSQTGVSIIPFSVASLDATAESVYEINASLVLMVADAPEQIATMFRSKTIGLDLSASNTVTKNSLILE